MTTEACCTPGPALDHEPAGKFTTFAGRDTYIASPPASSANASHVILFASDVFGPHYIYNQQNCDYLAATSGLTVIMPDIFKTAAAAPDFFASGPDAFKRFQTEWLPVNSPQDALAILKPIVQELRKQYKGVHCIGYCYGFFAGWHLSTTGEVDSAVGCHPSFLKPEDASGYNRPVLFNCAEQDQAFTPELKKTFETVAGPKGARFIVYPGTTHGFAARGDASVAEQRKRAHDEATKFFLEQVNAQAK
jgi:carboxymethylenebutenolidase